MRETLQLKTQYGADATKMFASAATDYNLPSKMHFYSLLPDLKGKNVLDAGCGDGVDLAYYNTLGAKCTGVDSSVKMVASAQAKGLDVKVGDFESLPFQSNSFDAVLSKYALQTSNDVSKAISEFGRVLKPGGYLQYLAVHPMRQFLERKKQGQDYFYQTTVESVLFDGKLKVYEPTHTLNDYYCPEFFKNFELLDFTENSDFPASEKIGDQTYPCYFIIKARKKSLL